jgi:hypothetical protein
VGSRVLPAYPGVAKYGVRSDVYLKLWTSPPRQIAHVLLADTMGVLRQCFR